MPRVEQRWLGWGHLMDHQCPDLACHRSPALTSNPWLPSEVVLWCRFSNFLSKQTEPDLLRPQLMDHHLSPRGGGWSPLVTPLPGVTPAWPVMSLVPGPRINNDRTLTTPATITFFSVTNWRERGAGNWISTFNREFPICLIFWR